MLFRSTDVQALVDVLHRAAIDTGVFPLGGIRTRAHACRHFRIADGEADAAWIAYLLAEK